MKYESDILKRLINTYGVVGNPRYISEIIKEFIVRGKERFPGLFTYQSDWLAHIDEFGLNPTYTVSYTGQSFYAPNTLERPVKSAILSGNTLVNMDAKNQILAYCQNDTSTQIQDDNYVTVTVPSISVPYSSSVIRHETSYGFIEGKTYTIISDASCVPINLIYNGGPILTPNSYRFAFVAPKNMAHIDIYYLKYADVGSSVTYKFPKKVVILEGDYTNIDIPYFEGMQSVKMPVLSTTGKNLLDVESVFKVDGNTVKEAKDGSVVLYKPSHNSFILETIKVKANTTYTISCEIEKIIDGGRAVYGIGGVTENKTAISDPNGNLVLFMRAGEQTNESEVKFYNIQLEEGSTATSYEPHKTNILTVNEEVELRGVAEVRDELNLLTGELTQRIGEIVLDGSHNIVIGSDNIESYETMEFFIDGVYKNGMLNHKQISDKLPYDFSNDDYEHFYVSYERVIVFVKKSKLATQDTNGFKQYLSQNPLTVQYQLETESIKTVDLTILDQNGQTVKQLMSFNGGTHFITKSLEGTPLPMASVSVETDLEETLRVCSLEGNTM